jgi:GcrA cell cycle regulator
MEWNDETIGRLRVLWSEGHSTAEIGRRMGVSKNAVVGKAHRLSLPARPSPIRRDGAPSLAPRQPAPRRVIGPTLPPLEAAEVVVEVAPAPVAVPTIQPVSVALRPVPVLRAVAAPAPAPGRHRTISCCWPIGEPGTKSFRFCDSDAMQSKPYCAEHAQLAYVKVRDRRDEAAA